MELLACFLLDIGRFAETITLFSVSFSKSRLYTRALAVAAQEVITILGKLVFLQTSLFGSSRSAIDRASDLLWLSTVGRVMSGSEE